MQAGARPRPSEGLLEAAKAAPAPREASLRGAPPEEPAAASILVEGVGRGVRACVGPASPPFECELATA